jgi:hypothetical protein
MNNKRRIVVVAAVIIISFSATVLFLVVDLDDTIHMYRVE